MNDYKNTLNLPITTFPMRGNLIKQEPIILNNWYKENLYKAIRIAKTGKKIFILHDGPPYANGKLHIGHSVNKILKDIIIKSKSMAGFDAPYIPGWDCHGLPIEHKVEQIIGKPNDKISEANFRKECRKYAKNQIDNQKSDFIRMGIIADWENPYLTMDFKIEANIIRTLGHVIKNNHLIRDAKPIYWCTDCSSSLAEAEVEYHDQTLTSIYVSFNAINPQSIYKKFNINHLNLPISIIIWTTTPWTLPANRAIAVNLNLKYQLVRINNKCLILAKSLIKKIMDYIKIKEWQVLGQCNGSELELIYFYHPFMNFNIPIVLSNHVTLDTGTGIVHIAPDHGPDDYIIGKKYQLKMANIISPNGYFLPNTHPILDGIFIFKANTLIINLLILKKALLHKKIFKHNHPYCWRHKIPIIFRATPQWFISMDKNNLRQQSLKEIEKIKWIPYWGQKQIKSMINNRLDWCISRQRTWGVPMPLFIHKKTGILHPNTLKIIEEIAKNTEKKGIQAWWDIDPFIILGNDTTNYIKINDTLDVWFDSGSTHYTVVNTRDEFKGNSANLYLEGSDQYRGWFMSSLMLSTAIQQKNPPYKEILTHGFTVDGQGRKMSKSIGNTISPQEIMNHLGADILRLWVASTDYTNEITISNEILNRSIDNYRRIRNTARFLLANLNGFNIKLHQVKPDDMIILDRWAVGQAKSAQEEIIKHYANYNFHAVIQRLIRFCSIEMGSFYLDIIKDRQYTAKNNSIARRSCQTALFHIIEALVRWIAPILSFTADEIWQQFSIKNSKYVFTDEYYTGLFDLNVNETLNNKFWNKLLIIRNEVNKVIEQTRINKIIHSSLEATIILYVDVKLTKILNYLGNELRFILLTSEVKIMDFKQAPLKAYTTILNGLKIDIQIAKGNKCPRCWHYTTDIRKEKKYTELCNRCINNIIGNGEIRKFA